MLFISIYSRYKAGTKVGPDQPRITSLGRIDSDHKKKLKLIRKWYFYLYQSQLIHQNYQKKKPCYSCVSSTLSSCQLGQVCTLIRGDLSGTNSPRCIKTMQFIIFIKMQIDYTHLNFFVWLSKIHCITDKIQIPIYSQLLPCGHPAITDTRYYGQNSDPHL